MKIQIVSAVILVVIAFSCKKKDDELTDSAGGSTPATDTCPTGYILAPPLNGYTTLSFCVAKYEMKNNTTLMSESSGQPYTGINKASALSACQSLGTGYDLITNNQWQTIARNIADQATNWSSGVAYSGELNTGHSDNVPANSLSANSDDNQACEGTGQSCSSSIWDSQRRTHTLSNGNVIWDFAGNIYEFIKEDNNSAQGTDGYASTFNGNNSLQDNFSNDTFCASPSSAPYCGFGWGRVNFNSGVILRGGYWTSGAGTAPGIFASDLSFGPAGSSTALGFRCVYQP